MIKIKMKLIHKIKCNQIKYYLRIILLHKNLINKLIIKCNLIILIMIIKN